MLALTWDFRTFSTLPAITQFLTDRLSTMHPTAFSLRDDAYLGLQQPFPDVAWVHMMFDFETDAGIAFGIARLVPTSDGTWKAHTVYTNLEGLKGFPEMIGPLRNPNPNHGKWEEDRRREREFEDREPTVVIIGGGQCGLDMAARLKCLSVPSLLVEKNPRIGDSWRNRYEALCLHDPVCQCIPLFLIERIPHDGSDLGYDHMPYLPYVPPPPLFSLFHTHHKTITGSPRHGLSIPLLSRSPTGSNPTPLPLSWTSGRPQLSSVPHLMLQVPNGPSISNAQTASACLSK